jgi:signal transduction histidine kinase
MALILSAVLLPKQTVLFFIAGFVAHLVLGFMYPFSVEFTNLATTIVYTVTSPLVLVFMYHRTGLERERRQELQTANAALQRSEADLERRVSDRTRDLKLAADVARQITTVLDLDQLLPQLVENTKAAFNLYFVSVFLYQPESHHLLLAVGTGEAGRKMQVEKRTFHLEVRPSLIAKAARHRQNIIINDVTQEEAHAANPYLPLTQSEAVLPMVVGDELIGVLGLQSEKRDRFGTAEVEIFSTLAEQIAIAVQNAQLYERQTQLAEELRQADQAKSQFLASMSHELRTPLNAIMNFTEMVAVGIMGPVNDEQKELLDQSLDSSKHLLNLINDVLDISKIQAGRLTLFVEDDVNLYAEVRTVVNMIEPLLKNKPVTLVQDIDDNLPLLTGDKRRIRQIMLNLVSNAAKFTDEGTITLSAKNRGTQVQLAVIDCGPGIVPAMQEVIFEPFMQTADGVKHALGTGLGLPITKSLVTAHNGRIWLESELGEGAAFYVTLPIHMNHNAKERGSDDYE